VGPCQARGVQRAAVEGQALKALAESSQRVAHLAEGGAWGVGLRVWGAEGSQRVARENPNSAGGGLGAWGSGFGGRKALPASDRRLTCGRGRERHARHAGRSHASKGPLGTARSKQRRSRGTLACA
jgi:hypothetical protein